VDEASGASVVVDDDASVDAGVEGGGVVVAGGGVVVAAGGGVGVAAGGGVVAAGGGVVVVAGGGGVDVGADGVSCCKERCCFSFLIDTDDAPLKVIIKHNINIQMNFDMVQYGNPIC